MTRIIAILSAILVIALCGAIYVVTMGRGGDDRFAQCRASAVAGGAGQIGGPFTLVDETGQTVTDVDVI
ncbi:MAG: SCO family protein, partial [Pseudomonadota bacterium]|nr:SCO family protein [Pseudomonadota bacterium]